MSTSLEKKYWSPRDQELWNKMKPKTNDELFNLIQDYWSELSGDNEFYFAIQMLRKRFNVILDKEFFGTSYMELKNGGSPENEIVEVIE